MAKNTSQGRQNNEYILASLNDDSDDETDSDGDYHPKHENYEMATLKEIAHLVDEIEKVKDKLEVAEEEKLLDNLSEYVLQIIIKLDNIDIKEYQKIKEARKDAILLAQGTLEKLDEKMCKFKTLE